MFFVKSKLNDENTLLTEINDENIFAECPMCGIIHSVDLEAIIRGGGSLLSSVSLCFECSEKHLKMQGGAVR